MVERLKSAFRGEKGFCHWGVLTAVEPGAGGASAQLVI